MKIIKTQDWNTEDAAKQKQLNIESVHNQKWSCRSRENIELLSEFEDK